MDREQPGLQTTRSFCTLNTRVLSWCRSQEGQLDPRALTRWYKTIATMRAEIQNWTSRHAKHAQVRG